jgi:hypothetical protein
MSRPSPAAQSVTGAVEEQGDTGITADGPEKNTHLLTSESPFWSQLESLYELYLSPTGLSQVNLSAPSMQGAQSAIVELKALMEAKPQYKTLSSISTPVDIEAGAEFLDMIKDSGLAASAREILHLMKMDTWTRFQHSKPFKKLRATVKAREGKTSPEQQCITIHPDPAKSK